VQGGRRPLQRWLTLFFRVSDAENEQSNKKRVLKADEKALKAAINQPLPRSTLSIFGPTNVKDVI
jgi:hypothetical protein